MLIVVNIYEEYEKLINLFATQCRWWDIPSIASHENNIIIIMMIITTRIMIIIISKWNSFV